MAIATLILIKAALGNRSVIASALGCRVKLAVCRSHGDVTMPVQRNWTRLEQQKTATAPGLAAGWIVADLIARLVALAFAILPAVAVAEPITLKLSFFSSDRSHLYLSGASPQEKGDIPWRRAGEPAGQSAHPDNHGQCRPHWPVAGEKMADG